MILEYGNINAIFDLIEFILKIKKENLSKDIINICKKIPSIKKNKRFRKIEEKFLTLKKKPEDKFILIKDVFLDLLVWGRRKKKRIR